VIYNITELKLHGSIDSLDEKGKSFTKKVIASAKNINYILSVKNEESYFEREDVLISDNYSPFERILSNTAQRFASFNEKIYFNHEKNSITFLKKLVNRDFTVKRDCYNFKWIITDEHKKIMGFDTKKAEGSYYNSVTNEALMVIAWYIPSIPLQSGPDIFMGLPGLIAQVELKGAVVTVKKIETPKNLEIQKLDDSKAMSQKEYEKLIMDLTQKFITD